MNFFNKSPKKTSKKNPASDEESNSSRSRSPPKKTPSTSSTSSKNSRPRERGEENSKASQGSSRNSRNFGKSGPGAPRHLHEFSEFSEHPLNLHPDQLRRLSQRSNPSPTKTMSVPEPDRMEVDTEVPVPITRESPPYVAPTSPPPPPAPASVPGAFESPKLAPKVNGTSKMDSEGPVPPPHKSNPTSPTPAAAPTPEDAEAFKAAGNKFYKAKEYRKAIDEYTKAVDAQPTAPTYLSNRAAAYMANGHYVHAMNDCVRADELDPSNPKILLRLARIYISLGRPEDALDTFARIQPPASAKDIAPAKSMLQHIKGAEEALKNGTAGSMALHALDQAEKLLGVGAQRPRKWQLMRGEACLKMGNPNSLGDASNIAMNLLRNNSQDPEALVLRGRALYGQGENDKAISHFKKAINCDPDYRDAVKYLRMVQKLDRMKTEGNAEYKGKRWQAAIDKYSEALEVDPLNKGTNSKILQNRALCRVQLKDYKGAIADCEKAISLDPSYTKAKKTKATALGQSGDWTGAVRELKELAEQEPQDNSIAQEVRKAELELKKSKRKDYYKILSLEKDADETQVKKAYRKAAIIHHPDKNPDDADAAERFKDVSEAYETLIDPEKRHRYDSGEDLIDPMEGFGGGGMGGGMGGIDPEILMQMFGAQMGGGGRGGGGGFHSFGGGMPGGSGGRRGAPQGFPQGFSFQ